MKALVSTAMVALIAMGAALPATTQPAEARNRGAKIAAGVILGAAALAIIGSSGRAHARDRDDDDEAAAQRRLVRHCQRLADRCSDGRQSACDQQEDECNGLGD
jgi:hypothetical protein